MSPTPTPPRLRSTLLALTAALLAAPTFAQESEEAQNLSWVTPAEGSDWSAGLPDFSPGDNVTFGTNAVNESVTLDQDIQAGDLTIEGDYTLNGNGALTAEAITVADGGTLTLGKKTITSARYVRLHITKRTASGNNSDGIAVAEVALFKGGEQLSWEGATATATNYSTHPAANLINGNLNDKWMWTAGTTFSVNLTFDAGEGKTFKFDGYNLASADQNGRNPTAWELQISNDGTSYTTVDTRTYEDAVAKARPTPAAASNRTRPPHQPPTPPRPPAAGHNNGSKETAPHAPPSPPTSPTQTHPAPQSRPSFAPFFDRHHASHTVCSIPHPPVIITSRIDRPFLRGETVG